MRRIAQLRFFCSQNGFLVYDASREPSNQSADLKKLSSPQNASKSPGWIRIGDAIAFQTVAPSNDHRIDVWRTPQLDAPKDADRVIQLNLSLPSGDLRIFSLDYGEIVELAAGDYILQCRAYNLGRELPEDAPPEDDAAFLLRDDLERYELVLAPGKAQEEGVISGPATLDWFSSRRP
ncbi:MAG TPA: hypothetical protein VFW23_01025 [Tepidisphaeraceae bacterium]|nr:hypothetical protein [Tepidisphaeraceae bacterium]